MRKITVLTIALLYVVSLAAVSAFAANAARSNSNNQAHMVSLDSRQQPLTETGPEPPGRDFSGKSSTDEMALGYFMSPGILLATTAYDIQHNSRMGRQVVVGSDNRVHFMWTQLPVGGLLSGRNVWYRSWTYGVQVLTTPRNISELMVKQPGRFGLIDVFNDRALMVWHYTVGAGWKTTSALDAGTGSGNFSVEDTPSDVINCQNIHCGSAFQPYIWPVAVADVGPTGNLVVHVAAMEGNTSAGCGAVAYFRGYNTGTNFTAGMYGSCGTFIDSVSATAYDISADPYSDRVVIAYPRVRQANRENNDVAYRLSTNLGVDWQPYVNVTNYLTTDLKRAGQELSVLFASDGYFHILWLENIYDSLGNSVSDQEVKLRHWSSGNPNCMSLVLDATNHDVACNTPAFRYNINKITLSQCISSALNDTLLYATYSRNLGTTDNPDCSDGGYFNGEIFISPSGTWGETWGAPVNLTNTKTNLCLPPVCADDGSVSCARYCRDSLRIEYMQDLDAGSFAGNEGGTAELANPMLFLSTPCITMAPYQDLTSTPSRITYPFHSPTGQDTLTVLTMFNGGNETINWNAIVTVGSDWITVPASGSVTSGCTNSAPIDVTIGPRSAEGLYQGTIQFTYNVTRAAKTLDVDVDFYVFDIWYLPQNAPMRTATNQMVVNQASQAAANILGSSYTYFADKEENFITDASLILGNSAQNLSWKIYGTNQGDPGTARNNFGRLYAQSDNDYDSTTFPNYRIASGKGTNRDSTVGFDVEWYAAKHVSQADFYIGHFELYKGVKDPTGTVSGLDIAFAADWDVPSDTGSNNTAGFDASRQMIYLQGTYTALHQLGYGSLAAFREDTLLNGKAVPIAGGFAWGNDEQVYNVGGYHVDSVWKYMEATNGYNSTWMDGDSIEDQTIVMVVAKNYTVTPTSRLKFDIVIAGKRAETNPTGLAGLNNAIDQAKDFLCTYLNVNVVCCTTCGDANRDGTVDISDAVYLISHIFTGGPPPARCRYEKGLGDANGDGTVDISDAVYLISRIFSGGPPPKCQI